AAADHHRRQDRLQEPRGRRCCDRRHRRVRRALDALATDARRRARPAAPRVLVHPPGPEATTTSMEWARCRAEALARHDHGTIAAGSRQDRPLSGALEGIRSPFGTGSLHPLDECRIRGYLEDISRARQRGFFVPRSPPLRAVGEVERLLATSWPQLQTSSPGSPAMPKVSATWPACQASCV